MDFRVNSKIKFKSYFPPSPIRAHCPTVLLAKMPMFPVPAAHLSISLTPVPALCFA